MVETNYYLDGGYLKYIDIILGGQVNTRSRYMSCDLNPSNCYG